jgi:hypothetical protein
MQRDQHRGDPLIHHRRRSANPKYELALCDESDSQKSPTISVTSACNYSPAEKSQRLLIQSSFKQSKRVRFNENLNQFYDDSNVHTTNAIIMPEDVWYSARDVQQFLASTRNYGRAIACNEWNDASISSYRETMQQTYQACCRVTTAMDDDDDVTMMENSNGILTLQEERSLERCMAASTSRLGIERLAVLSIGRDCSQRKQELQQAVFEIQQEQPAASHQHHQAELIRQSCEKLSRTSRLFFQVLAQAAAADTI